VSRGFYDRSIEAFFENISPSRVLIVTLEQSRSQPEETMAQIYEFIGVDATRGLRLAGTQHNENWTMVARPWSKLPVISSIERTYITMTERFIVRLTKNTVRRRRARKYSQLLFRKPASGIAIPGKIRSELSSIYRPHIKRLESMLGRQFPEWRQ
jgi:hypothetical protein